MTAVLQQLKDISLFSVALRMLLAVLCGGLIGLEREDKRRPAGFRTHILICLGAAMTTLTSQYLCMVVCYDTDIARLGAQVISGVGFIGAGTIIVSRHQRVKGLTTAAGLWTAAVIGLALGAGFYEGGILTTVLVLLAETVFSRLEYLIMRNTPEVNLYMEFSDRQCLEAVRLAFREKQVKILNMEITRFSKRERRNISAILSLRLNRKFKIQQLLELVGTVPGVLAVEEI